MNQNENSFPEKKINKQNKQINKWKKTLNNLEKKINYSFKNRGLLEVALTHKSFTKTITNINSSEDKSERMEFFGDSVLELIVTEFLYNKYPNKNEGNLTKMRSKIISKNFLYKKSREISLNKYILIGDEGLKSKFKKNVSINSDAMESLFAAIFLDSTYLESKYVIKNMILNNIENELNIEEFQNFKSYLQEWSQAKFECNPEYNITKETGPEHKKKFYVEVIVADKYKSKGCGNSKKTAEQNAARNLVKRLKITAKISQ